MPQAKDGWIGLWILPFAILTSIVVSILFWVARFGYETIREGRIIYVIVFGSVILVVYLIMYGWSARQAVKQVYDVIE